MTGSWDAYLASPADFAGVDDIITNLAKEREPGDIERTPSSLIITSLDRSAHTPFPTSKSSDATPECNDQPKK